MIVRSPSICLHAPGWISESSSNLPVLTKPRDTGTSGSWSRQAWHWSLLAGLAARQRRGLPSRRSVPESLIEGWVVKYQKPTGSPDANGLGLAVVDADGQLQPLCTWEEGERTFVVDEDAKSFEAEDRVVQVLDAFISSRQMPRPVNPHGEEVEDTYLIDEEEDLEDVEIVVKPECEPSMV